MSNQPSASDRSSKTRRGRGCLSDALKPLAVAITKNTVAMLFSYSSPSQAQYDNPSSIVAASPPGTPSALSLEISSSMIRWSPRKFYRLRSSPSTSASKSMGLRPNETLTCVFHQGPSDQLKMTVCNTAVLHLLSVDPAHAAESNRNYWACAQWGSSWCPRSPATSNAAIHQTENSC
ncbi:DNA gyrase/topoisomerase IV [Pseudomonas syringae pv. actinidiae]|uniref:DNA gyrase/topoisomerase IV n=1 Tax=Pseudomonas syringae pv. actinidiae TaxID=103796 RepID=A0A2V0Q4Z3_PSESF|nr:DNA gyrase/topoisomerase IV [Pseudomonas syringae pv. actinidiae]